MRWLKGRRQLLIMPPEMKAAFMARTAIMGYALEALIGTFLLAWLSWRRWR
jgi:hypothetical protein